MSQNHEVFSEEPVMEQGVMAAGIGLDKPIVPLSEMDLSECVLRECVLSECV